ncbi:lysophospholipase catalytic domain-containing protein [Zopfochytrium polystomum]|nr:lysophospholipase catalytic domain-containing protein [Zopfochytrium polystomum]
MTKEGALHAARTVASSAGIIFLILVGNYLSFWFSATSPFAPRAVKCPATSPSNSELDNGILRMYPSLQEQTLPEEEIEWLKGRDAVARGAWKSYLDRANLEGFDVDKFVKSQNLPTVALAFSGGGSRALLVGAGVIRAMDDRIEDSVEKGTGGILQLSSYISGLSGGSFLIGSLYTTDFKTIDYLHDHVWKLDKDTFTPTGDGVVADFGVYYQFMRDMAHKARAGYPTTITDYWSRLVSVHTTDDEDYGVNLTMSKLGTFSNFQSYKTPFPVVVWNERLPTQRDLDEYANIWESSIFESGSWSPTIQGFVKTKYIGTYMDNGVPTKNKCTVGFDHFGYVVGISSSVFNQALQDLDRATNSKLLSPVIQFMTNKEVDAALVPNPFYGIEAVDNRTSTVKEVSLVDGGEDGQNIPIWPFLQPSREVDVIFATDSTVSFYEGGWPNGSSILSTARYAAFSGIGFPPTPPTEQEFLDLGLVNRTVFFGCERAPAGHVPYPLLVYIPNRYYSYPSNASTFRRVYPAEDSRPFLMNGFDIFATAGAQNPVPEDGQKGWAACVACSMISRSETDLRKLTPQCKKCLRDYCWSPTRIEALYESDEAIEADKKAVAAKPVERPALHPLVVDSINRRKTLPHAVPRILGEDGDEGDEQRRKEQMHWLLAGGLGLIAAGAFTLVGCGLLKKGKKKDAAAAGESRPLLG